MCGIAGGYAKPGIDQTILKQATDAMLHRGPDSGGYYTNDERNLFLGHRRLSIIDLSTVANQPMHSADGRYVMVYNGEIYNFEELRSKLPGHNWRTHSDTEVALELFAKFGTESFQWLNGMFALAIYDTHDKKTYICRDQLGIKPIFYYWANNTFIFASELKAVKKYCSDAGIKLAVNRTAIPFFLHLGYIPEPQSIYQDVYKFPSGHYGIIDTSNASLTIQQYWKPAAHYLHHPVTNEQEGLRMYKEALFQSVQSQMVSDVPLGTFLSGGIDSSLVTAAASKLSAAQVKTFSIGFNEAKYDETQYAAAVAKHLGTDHHIFKVSVNDVLELIPRLQAIYDEPFADSSAFPTMLVSQLARQQVTVVLSGDGGDEMFQGYGMYTWATRLQKPFFKTFRKPVYAATQLMGNRMKRGGKLFNYISSRRLHSHIFSQEQYFFSEQELGKLLYDTTFDFHDLNETGVPATKGNPAEQQAFWDMNHYLKDDLLVKVDRASMQCSLETRVPLLDLRVVELALNLGYNLKISKEYGTKHLMKKVLYEMVPRELFERPKRGFAIPLKEWLQGPLQHLVTDYLSRDVIEQYGIVHYAQVAKLKERFSKGEDFLYNRLWVLIVLHWWLKENEGGGA